MTTKVASSPANDNFLPLRETKAAALTGHSTPPNHPKETDMAGKGRPGVALVVALVLLVAGAAIIVVNLDGHPIGVIGGAVTALVGVGFLIRGVATRRTTPEGRRRFFMS
jgi:hypothetical protein